MRINFKSRIRGGQNLTAVEGNASFYEVNPVSRITGEGRAECFKTWGPGFDQERARGRGGAKQRTGGAAQSVRGNYTSFEGINLTVLERMHQYIMGGAGSGTGGAA